MDIRFESARAIAYKPLLVLLKKLRATPNSITVFRLILAIPFFFIYQNSPMLGAGLYVFIIFLDTLDGTYARFLKKTSDRNRFFDLFADTIIHGTLILALIHSAIIQPTYGALYILLLPSTTLLAVICKNERKKSDWIIHPRADRVIYKAVIDLLFIADTILLTLTVSRIMPIILALLFLDGSVLLAKLLRRR